jgi:hypothetical protein
LSRGKKYEIHKKAILKLTMSVVFFRDSIDIVSEM